MKRGLGGRGKGIFDKPDILKKKGSKVEKYKSTKVEKKKQISLWLPENLVRSLKIKAVTQGKTISDFIKEDLEEKLK